MTDENGQEPDMSDAEIAQAERDQIMMFDADYVDALDTICNTMPALSNDLRDEFVTLIKMAAAGSGLGEATMMALKGSFGVRMIDAIGKQVRNEHRL